MSMTQRVPEVLITSFAKDLIPSTGETTLVKFNAKLAKETGDASTVVKYHAAMREFIRKVKKKKDFLPSFYEFKAVCISLNLYHSKHGRRAVFIPKSENLNVKSAPESTFAYDEFDEKPESGWRTRVEDPEIRAHLEALERPPLDTASMGFIRDDNSLDALLRNANQRVNSDYKDASELTKRLKSKIENAILELEMAKEKLEGLMKLDQITASDPTILKLLISLKDDLDSIEHKG